MKKFTYGMAALVLFLCLAFVGCNNPAVSSLLNPPPDNSGLGPINTSLVKTVYTEGDSLDLSNLTAGTMNYNALAKSGLLNISISKEDDKDTTLTLNHPGFQDVTIAVTGVKSAGYKIFVNPKPDAEDSIPYYPITKIVSGNDTDGYKVDIDYPDGVGGTTTVQATLPVDCTGVSSVTPDTDDKGKVIVTYDYDTGDDTTGTKTTPGSIAVAPVLTGIAVTPLSKTYTVDDKFQKSDFTVTATYDDSTAKVVTDYDVDFAYDTTFDTAGTKTVNVSYTENGVEAKAEFTAIVNEAEPAAPVLTGITVDASKLAKSVYFVGETLDLTDLVVKAIYDNDPSTARVVTDYSTSPKAGDTLKFGDNLVSVSYTKNGETADPVTFPITVNHKLIGIAVTPSSKTYTVDEEFQKSDFTVTATYDYDDSKPEPVFDYTVSHTYGTTFDTGTTKVEVSYTDAETGITKTAEFTATVNVAPPVVPVLKGITVTPSSKTYTVGDEFLKSDFAVTATYDKGEPKTVTDDCAVDLDYGTTFRTVGSKTVTVSYTDSTGTVSNTFDVTIVPRYTITLTRDRLYPKEYLDSFIEISAVYNEDDGPQVLTADEVVNSALVIGDYDADYVVDSNATSVGVIVSYYDQISNVTVHHLTKYTVGTFAIVSGTSGSSTQFGSIPVTETWSNGSDLKTFTFNPPLAQASNSTLNNQVDFAPYRILYDVSGNKAQNIRIDFIGF